MKLSELSIKNSLLVNMISLFIVFAGIVTMMRLPRDAFPQVDFDIVTITTQYAGAPAEDVEKFVTIPIEKEIRGVSGIKEMESTSDEGLSLIGITIDPEAGDKEQVVEDIKDAVDRVRNLPTGVEDDPVVFELKSKERPVLEISISGPFDEKIKRGYAEALEDKILDVNGVAGVKRIGWRDPELWVELHADKMAEYYVSFDEVVRALRSRNITLPGGQLTTADVEYNVRVTGEFQTAQEVGDVIVRSNDAGKTLKIKDIAVVKDTFEDRTSIAKLDGEEAVTLVVVKTEKGDVVRLAKRVRDQVELFQQQLPDEMKATVTNDFSYYVKRRLDVLKNNGIIGLGLVLILLFLFLSPIPALATAFGIPIALFITFMMMQVFGITINLVSMLGLIIVLGMLVDDGIIVAENVYRYIEKGMPPREAAVKGAQEVILPVTVTILTTCAAFAPLLFMKDILGKFIREIPMVVMIALAASLFEAFIILPAHLADFVAMRKNGKHTQHKPVPEKKWFVFIKNKYTRLLSWALSHRYIFVFGLLIPLFFGAIVIWQTHMKTILFTDEGIEEFYVRAEAPKGTPLAKMNELLQPVEQLVVDLPEQELDAYRTYIGSIEEDRGFDPNAKRGTHLAQITVYLTPFQERERSPREIANYMRKELKKIDGFEKLYIFIPKPGPPLGRAVSVGIKGDEFSVLQEMAQEYVAFLENIDGVSDVETTYNFGKKQLKVVVNEEKARQYYLNIQDIATVVRTAFKGQVATTVKPIKAEEEVAVVVRYREQDRNQKEVFKQILVPNRFDKLVPLSAVAEIIEEDGVYAIDHLDGKRVVSVLADVDSEIITSLEVNNMLKQEFADEEDGRLGYSVIYSGEYEKQQESSQNLLISFSFALCIIFIILTAMFNSVIQPFIVMMAIPFGMIGVIFAFLAHGRPLSFFGLIGVVGLTGVVVNDSIVLVDFINRARKQGKGRRESLIEGGQTRLRPVIMTSVTTIGGLVSVAYGFGGGDPFLKPMALAIIWGLLFATVLILVVTPCIYAIFDDFTEKILHRSMVKQDESG